VRIEVGTIVRVVTLKEQTISYPQTRSATDIPH
jgi:hypothetical protein